MGPPRPDVSVRNATIPSGESGTITVEARDIGGLRFRAQPGTRMRHRLRPEPATPRVAFGDVSFSEPPSETLHSYPPRWIWSGTRSAIVVEVPVGVADDVPAGRYEFAVAAKRDLYDEEERAVVATFVVEVPE